MKATLPVIVKVGIIIIMPLLEGGDDTIEDLMRKMRDIRARPYGDITRAMWKEFNFLCEKLYDALRIVQGEGFTPWTIDMVRKYGLVVTGKAVPSRYARAAEQTHSFSWEN